MIVAEVRMRLAISIVALLCSVAVAADDTVDWLLGKGSTTKPSTQPSSRPTNPFEHKEDAEARPGVITLSNGEKVRGKLSTTREKPIRVWDEGGKKYRDIPFDLIRSMEAKVLWEREEKEWAFKESGSDIKIYSGKTYPARELQYVITLINGQKVSGGVVSPVYANDGERTRTFVLNKRQKGEVGQTLKDLVYLKTIEFDAGEEKK
jgi:hypothetical protein